MGNIIFIVVVVIILANLKKHFFDRFTKEDFPPMESDRLRRILSKATASASARTARPIGTVQPPMASPMLQQDRQYGQPARPLAPAAPSQTIPPWDAPMQSSAWQTPQSAAVESPPAPAPQEIHPTQAESPPAPAAPEMPAGIPELLAPAQPLMAGSATLEAMLFQPQAFEQRMDMAGLIVSRLDENLPIPGIEPRGHVLQLKNMKRMAVVPAGASPEWLQSILRVYDYVLVIENGQATILRRFDEFLKDQMFG